MLRASRWFAVNIFQFDGPNLLACFRADLSSTNSVRSRTRAFSSARIFAFALNPSGFGPFIYGRELAAPLSVVG